MSKKHKMNMFEILNIKVHTHIRHKWFNTFNENQEKPMM